MNRSLLSPSPRLVTLLCTVALLTTAPLGAAEVIKSPNDPRVYRALELPNRLKVILISDPETDMAAASLSVDVGSQANPADREGLAHFLEHMLFLGTGKYPDASEYKDFMSRNGGADNAYTSGDETNYFFEVKAQALEEALERFSRFFIDPLFTAKYVDRERQVVHSEYLGRKQSDGRRTWSAKRVVMNPEHPASQFAVGNLETLADRPGSDIRDELIAFYERHYSANLMALTVVGKEPLDTLERWIRSRFESIPDRDAARPVATVPLYSPDRLPAWLDVVPEKEQRLLQLTFPIPPIRKDWRSKPSAHVGHLLGHEGEGSLLAELKRRGWARSLSAGPGYSDDHQATFNIGIQLTPEGLKHTDAVIALLFRTVALVRARGVESWIFDENRRLGEIGFHYQEKLSPMRLARRLSSLQHTLPQAEVLRGGYLYEAFLPDRIYAILDHLTPGNMLVTRVAPDLPSAHTTRWYDAPYRLAPISPVQRTAWLAAPADAQLALPAANLFIPDELVVRIPASPPSAPVAIDERPGFTLWHKQDAIYRLPKADFFVSVRSPHANGSPRGRLLTGLYVDLVNDALNSFAYPAELAGLSFSLYPHLRGFTMRISGYDQRQPALLENILRTLTGFEVDPARFEILRAERKRRLLNTRLDQPYEQAMRRLRGLIIEPRWSVAEQLAIVDSLTPRQLQAFVPRLLSEVEVVALSHGNVTEEAARAQGETVHAALVAPATPTTVERARVRKLRRGDRLGVDLELDHPESALVMYLQGPDASLHSRAHAGLLSQVLSSPFFDRLRTERKLGYVVFANAFPVLDTAGLVFIAQSPIADAATLAREMRDFFQGYAETLETMTDDEFDQHRRALVARVLEEERQLGDRSNRYWDEIDRGNPAFDMRERIVAAVQAVTPDSLVDFYREAVAEPMRRQLVIGVRGEKRGESLAPSGSVTAEQLRAQRGLIPG